MHGGTLAPEPSHTTPEDERMPTRHATAEWKGGLKGGRGSFRGETGAVAGDYSAGSRFEEAGGSNPEELLAAAEAACFTMALSGGLERAGAAPTKLETRASCTIEKAGEGFKITRMKLEVRGTVPDMSEQQFRQAAEAAKEGCPVSQVLKGNVPIELDAKLA